MVASTSPPAVSVAPAPPPPPSRSLVRTFAALSNIEFRYLWFGTLGSFLANQMQAVAFGYAAFVLTGSAVALGAVSLATGGAQTIFSLFSGAIIDRLPKRRMMLITQSALGAIALVNFILVAMGVLQLWQLAVVAFLQGTVFAFNMPTRNSFLALLTRDVSETQNAIALNTAGMNLMRVIGPSIAGGILAIPVFGLQAVFFGITLSYGWVLFSITHIKNRGEVEKVSDHSVITEIKAGWSYIFRNPILRSLLFLSLVTTLASAPFQILMPVFALKVFDVGSAGLGLMVAISGAGALTGALTTAYFSDSKRKGEIQFWVGLLFGLAIAAYAMSPNVWVAIAPLFLAGACGSMLLSLNNSLLMLNSTKEMYGRVMSAYMISFGIFPIGTIIVGWLADQFSAPFAIAASGLALTLTMLIFGLVNPALRRLR